MAAGVEPNVISFNAIIQACARADQPAAARQIFEEASRAGKTNIVTFNAVLDAVCTHDAAEARALWRRACERGLYAKVERSEGAQPLLDLHGHSEGAAETAVRWWLEQRVPAMDAAAERLIIVTGWGKSRDAAQEASQVSGDIRARVERVLAEVGAPTLPSDNPGNFVVDARAWAARSRASTPQRARSGG